VTEIESPCSMKLKTILFAAGLALTALPAASQDRKFPVGTEITFKNKSGDFLNYFGSRNIGAIAAARSPVVTPQQPLVCVTGFDSNSTVTVGDRLPLPFWATRAIFSIRRC
jgi:hypothetical protein